MAVTNLWYRLNRSAGILGRQTVSEWLGIDVADLDQVALGNIPVSDEKVREAVMAAGFDPDEVLDGDGDDDDEVELEPASNPYGEVREMRGPSGVDLPGVELPGVDLPGMELPGMDLPGVELPGMELPGVELPGVDLPGVELPGWTCPTWSCPGWSCPGDFRPPDAWGDSPGGHHPVDWGPGRAGGQAAVAAPGPGDGHDDAVPCRDGVSREG